MIGRRLASLSGLGFGLTNARTLAFASVPPSSVGLQHACQRSIRSSPLRALKRCGMLACSFTNVQAYRCQRGPHYALGHAPPCKMQVAQKGRATEGYQWQVCRNYFNHRRQLPVVHAVLFYCSGQTAPQRRAVDLNHPCDVLAQDHFNTSSLSSNTHRAAVTAATKRHSATTPSRVAIFVSESRKRICGKYYTRSKRESGSALGYLCRARGYCLLWSVGPRPRCLPCHLSENISASSIMIAPGQLCDSPHHAAAFFPFVNDNRLNR